MELTNIHLPKGLSKTINDLARSREKSAKQKYLIDLAESPEKCLLSRLYEFSQIFKSRRSQLPNVRSTSVWKQHRKGA
jgi:hypothetical protein